MTDNLRQLPYGWAKRYIGHSPVGSLFLIGMLMLALVVSASGWASSVAAVAFGSWRARDNLLLSMVRGTKLGSPDEAIQNARHGVAMLLVAAVLCFSWYEWQSDTVASTLTGQLVPVHRGKGGVKS